MTGTKFDVRLEGRSKRLAGITELTPEAEYPELDLCANLGNGSTSDHDIWLNVNHFIALVGFGFTSS
jgi:hypothetical protein